MSHSSLFTEDVARIACGMVRPSIEALIKTHVLNSSDLAIVVLKLNSPDDLWVERIGDPTMWPEPLEQNARSKAHVSFQTGLDSHRVQQRQPHLFLSGDIRSGGGVNFDKIVVGVCGPQWYYDEMIGYWVAIACRTLCIQGMTQVMKDQKTKHLP